MIFLLGQVLVELWIELLPNLLWEAKSTKLCEIVFEEIDLRLLKLTFGQLQEQWLRLTKISASCLAE